jgi:hypothetical protein
MFENIVLLKKGKLKLKQVHMITWASIIPHFTDD